MEKCIHRLDRQRQQSAHWQRRCAGRIGGAMDDATKRLRPGQRRYASALCSPGAGACAALFAAVAIERTARLCERCSARGRGVGHQTQTQRRLACVSVCASASGPVPRFGQSQQCHFRLRARHANATWQAALARIYPAQWRVGDRPKRALPQRHARTVGHGAYAARRCSD